MIPKIIAPGSQDFNCAQVSILPCHRRGVDSHYLMKAAKEAGGFALEKEISELKPIPGHTVIHTIAVGDQERYGLNRNCDGFSRDDNKKCHHRFRTQGHVFKDHANSDPQLKTGKVVATAHNDVMDRIELLAALENAKYAEELEGLEKGKDIPVSMGCFTAGHLVTLEDGTTRPIEDLVVGDYVLTHLGNHSVITELFQKPYTASLYTITAKTSTPIECTANHPFFVLRKALVRATSHRRHSVDEIDITKAAWVPASDLQSGDYLVTPCNRVELVDDEFSPAVARLLGYYCAEGHLRNTPAPAGAYCDVILSVGTKDAAVTEVPELCAQLGWDCRIRPSQCSVKGLAITIHSPELGYLCAKHCGRHAKKKQLSYELMTATLEIQRHFLGAYINGDGCQSVGTSSSNGAITISTASTFLRDQIRQLLMRVGATPGMNTITHKAGSGFSAYKTIEYQVYVARTDVSILTDYCHKAVPQVMTRQRGGRRLRVAGVILTPIDSVVARVPVQPVQVYNIEVEPDNSYVVNGFAVHNSMQEYDVCTVCKHKAPTAKDHCDHVKNHLGDVTKDGVHIGMENPDPQYFDLSTVWKPADRIGYTIRKVALELGVVGGDVLADRYGMTKFADAKLAVLRRLASIEKLCPAQAKVVSTAPEDLDDENEKLLKRAVAAHGVDAVLEYLHKHAFVLSPRTFAAAILGAPKLAASAAPGVPALLPEGFNRILGHGDLAASLDGRAPATEIKIAEELHGALRESCSMHPAEATRRVLWSSLGSCYDFGTVKVAQALPDPTATTGLAELYLRYKLACANHPANRADNDVLRTLVQSNVLSA